MADESVQIPPVAAAAEGGASSNNNSLWRKQQQCFTWSRVKTNSSTNSSTQQQQQQRQVLPPPRSGAASVVVRHKLYVFGGYGGGTGRLDDFWSYDFEMKCWEPVEVLSTIKPGCRENNGVVISDDSSRSIYLFGGYNGDCWLNDLWRFDITTKHWTCIQESSGPVRADESNAAVGEQAAANDDQQLLAPGQKKPTRRFGYVSVVHDGKFVLFGGFDGAKWLNDMYVFDFPTNTWTEIQAKGSIPTARSCPAWAKDATHVYIQGGYDGVERKSDFFALNLETYTWTQMPSLGTPPSPRYFHSCCLYGNRMYLYGGYSGTKRLADMYAYDFDTNHWSQIDCTSGDPPSGRSSLVAQVYENSLYVFGGYNGSTVLNDFFRFKLKPIGVPPSALVSDLARLINNTDLADVQFLVEGKIVNAHKCVLAIRSEYFRVMLCGGMRESSSSAMAMMDTSTTEGTTTESSATAAVAAAEDSSSSFAGGGGGGRPIELPDVSYNVFLKVLEFLYTDSIRDTSLEVGIHLMIASEQFMLDRLKAICEDLIRHDISTETVVSILVASHRHNATGLKEIAFEFILRNLNNPVIMSGLSELKAEPDLLLEIIRRSSHHHSQQQQQQQLSQQQQNMVEGGEMNAGLFGINNLDWNAQR